MPTEEHKIFLFDVDGTLTVSRKEITSEMREFMNDTKKKVTCGIVGGSDINKQKHQLGSNVIQEWTYVFAENGLDAYKNGKQLAKQNLAEILGDDNIKELVNAIMKYISGLDIPLKRGTFIEFRSGMLNVSPIGRNCSRQERNEFEIYDKQHKVRETMIEALSDLWQKHNLKTSIGGQISFDVFPNGWDKTFCLPFVEKDGFTEIHFFGDKTWKGGNDYEIFKSSKTIGHTVKSPAETREIITKLLEGDSKKKRMERVNETGTENEKLNVKKRKIESDSKQHPCRQLMNFSSEGNIEQVKLLLSCKIDPCWQDKQGKNALMLAASKGNYQISQLLLNKGVPWNALDISGLSAGDYARKSGCQKTYDTILNAGIRAELLLEVLEYKKKSKSKPTKNNGYLQQKLTFKNGQILDAENNAVMMGWEAPLMDRHAKIMFTEGNHQKDVLNIGFGLGLIDKAIQQYKPKTHTIIEAHPDVYAHMIEEGWDQKEGVKILFGRWQEKIYEIDNFDAIFFDTYGEYYSDMKEFHEVLPMLLRKGGIYSYFNGLAASTNAFFHDVYCKLVAMELKRNGFTTDYMCVPTNTWTEPSQWEGIRRKYWILDVYNLPVVRYTEDKKYSSALKINTATSTTTTTPTTPTTATTATTTTTTTATTTTTITTTTPERASV